MVLKRVPHIHNSQIRDVKEGAELCEVLLSALLLS